MNEKNSLKVRQICFIFIALAPITKLTLFPSFLAGKVGQGAILSAAIGAAFDLFVLSALIFLSKKHDNKTLYAVLRDGCGEWAAKTVFAIYSVYFFLKAFLFIVEQKYFIENSLYEIMPPSVTFYPFFIISTFICLKGLKIIGRIADVAVFVTAAGLILTFILSVGSGDYTNLLPINEKPAYNLVNTAFKSIVWQSDAIAFAAFYGHFDAEKGWSKKVFFSYAAAQVTVLSFVAIFIAVYGHIAPSQRLALSSISVFGVTATNVGRFDFLAIFSILFSQVFAISLPLMLSSKSLERVFGCKSALLPSLIVNVAAAVLLIVFGKKPFLTQKFYTDNLPYFFFGVSAIVTAFLIMIPRTKNEVS